MLDIVPVSGGGINEEVSGSGSGANNIPPIVGRDARQQPPLLISADTPPVAITPLTLPRNVKFLRYWTHNLIIE